MRLFMEWMKGGSILTFLPIVRYCIDNGAMIACAGLKMAECGMYTEIIHSTVTQR